MSSSPKPALSRAAAFLFPVILLAIAYWSVWDVWFRADDFAWLGLRLPIKNFATFWDALFQPMAQGTVRFLSERAFFLTFSTLFGNDPLPMRIFIYLVQVANVALLGHLTFRLSGSLVTAALVPSIWLINPGVVVSMSWLSTWNQLLVVFFLLAALVAFIEKYKVLCWISFLLGFGALEVNIVFPALLLVYVWLYERDRLREVWPFFLPSLLFVGLHLFVIPKNKQDPTYQLVWDLQIPRRLFHYWKWGLGFWRFVDLVGAPLRWERLGSPALTLLGAFGVLWGFFSYWRGRMEGRLALLGLAWFVGLLAPILPLANHFSDYYLASASIGSAMILGTAVCAAWTWHRVAGTVACLLLACMTFASWRVKDTTIGWYREHSQATERLVRGVVEARRLHPNDALLIDGIDNSLFWDGVMDDPFRLYLVFDVYLTPGSERKLGRSIAGDDFSPYLFPPEDTRYLLEHEAVQVYRVGAGPLRNVTRAYHREQEAELPHGTPRFIELAKPAYEELLGKGWHPVADRARWTEGEADLRIGAPQKAGQSLWLNGYVPEMVVKDGPQVLTLTANGQKLPPVTLAEPNSPLVLAVPLPETLIGQKELSLHLQFSRVIMQRGRQHSLILRRVAVR